MNTPIKVKTLRIKRIYFDRILSGEKKIEYRDFKEYYHGLFKDNPTHLFLHYQAPRRALVEVKKIEVIKTPEKLKDSKISFGAKVYAIHLGRSREIEK